jgi:hypothetical protein
MDTRRIRTAEAGLDAANAIAQLERANGRLLECRSFDAVEIESALAERDEAVRAIAAVDPASLHGPFAERLLRALEDGRRIRQKLAAFYRGTDAKLRQLERMHAGDPAPPQPPGISVVA